LLADLDDELNDVEGLAALGEFPFDEAFNHGRWALKADPALWAETKAASATDGAGSRPRRVVVRQRAALRFTCSWGIRRGGVRGATALACCANSAG
jgi:hypothetical protein